MANKISERQSSANAGHLSAPKEEDIQMKRTLFSDGLDVAGFDDSCFLHGDSTSPLDREVTSENLPASPGTNGNTVALETNVEDASCIVFDLLDFGRQTLKKHSRVIKRGIKIVVFLLFLAYTGYSLSRTWGTEGATRLLVLLTLVLLATVGHHLVRKLKPILPMVSLRGKRAKRLRKGLRWSLYVVASGGVVTYIVVQVAPYRLHNLLSLAGLAVLLLTSFLLSDNPRKISWHTVFWGCALQFYLALFVLRTQVGYKIFDWMGSLVKRFVLFTDSGSKIVFGEAYVEHRFVFQGLPVLLFVNAAMAVGYYYGVVQRVVMYFGRLLALCLGTSPVESVNTAANIFLSLLEAPLLIRPYLPHVTVSELFAIMTGGFASISGVTMAYLVTIGIPTNHLLTASIMSAPAALAVAKLMCPETSTASFQMSKNLFQVNTRTETGVIAAVCKAAQDAAKLAVIVAANLLVFVAALDFADHALEWFAEQAGIQGLTYRRLMSYLFYPLLYLEGVDGEDLLTMGRVVGVRLVGSYVLGYQEAARLISNSKILADYVTQTNDTWHYDGDDVILDAWNRTLIGGALTERSVVMSVYVLCGFCSIGALAVSLGTLATLVPSRANDILKISARTCLAGNIACHMTACVVGLLLV